MLRKAIFGGKGPLTSRWLSTKVPSSPVSNIKPPSVNGGNGLLLGVLFVTSTASLSGFVGYKFAVAYETDQKVRDNIDTNFPQLVPTIENFGKIFRDAGLIEGPPTTSAKGVVVTKIPETLEHKVDTQAAGSHPTTSVIIEKDHVEAISGEPVVESDAGSEAAADVAEETQHSVEHDGEAQEAQSVSDSNSQHHDHSSTSVIVDHVAPDSLSSSSASTVTIETHTSEHETAHAVPSEVFVPEYEPARGSTDHAASLPAVSSEQRAKSVLSEVVGEVVREQAQHSVALRREIESTLLQDLSSLDAAALRNRVTQLASELFDRANWEGIRLHQSSKQMEADLIRKYTELLEHQHRELEAEANKQISEKERVILDQLVGQSKAAIIEFDAQLHQALRNQFDVLNARLTEALQQQANEVNFENRVQNLFHFAQVRDLQVKQLMTLQDQLLQVVARLTALDKTVDKVQQKKADVQALHKQCAAIIALESALQTPRPVAGELAAVGAAFPEDDFVNALVGSIPDDAIEAGAPTIAELRKRFKVVRQEVRKVAMAPPDAPNMIGQLVGSALSHVAVAPEGNVSGTGVEESLARAAFHLENNRLYEAIVELNDMPGDVPKGLASDWSDAALVRLQADNVSKALKAHVAIIASL